MLKFVTSDVVFQEIPDEVTLAIDISNCPCHCKGCHSPFLWKDEGAVLTEDSLVELIMPYEGELTCIGFMGGDIAPLEVAGLAAFVRKRFNGTLKTAWYSGRQTLPEGLDATVFDYVKLGPYIEEKGPLKEETTNQRMYRINRATGKWEDITYRFWRKGMPDGQEIELSQTTAFKD